MINYIEKGKSLHKEIVSQGYHIINQDGVWQSSDDVAVQAIIDAYDPLPFAKNEAIARIKKHAAILVNAIYPHIDPNSSDVIGFYNYTVDMYSGSFPLTGRLLELKTVRDSAVTKIAEVNALVDWQSCDTYDATSGW